MLRLCNLATATCQRRPAGGRSTLLEWRQNIICLKTALSVPDFPPVRQSSRHHRSRYLRCYGSSLDAPKQLKQLSKPTNLFRQFFLTFPEIRQTVSGELEDEKRQTASGELADEKLPTGSGELTRRDDSMIAALKPAMSRFQLPWSSDVRLLALRNDKARQFCEIEALRCGWTVRQLGRQISSHHRTNVRWTRFVLRRDRRLWR